MKSNAPLLSLSNGSFSYGRSQILTDLSLTIEEGKFYGLIGPNGSGKSTLIDILMGISSLNEGNVLHKGIPLNTFRKRELAKHLALVPQSVNIGFEFTVYEIVLMGRHPHIARFNQPSETDYAIVDEAIKLLDISTLKNRPVTQLSGGEKQRVIVARAIAQDTKVLMLDEATSNLDIEHTLEIMRVLHQKVRNTQKTVIAAIHDLNLAAAFCDEIIVLKDGKICNFGPVEDILTVTLINDVFSVKADVIHHNNHIRIEFEMNTQ